MISGSDRGLAPATADRPPERWLRRVEMLLLAAGAGIVLFGLGARSLWLDEAASFSYARSTWSEFRQTLWRDSNASLYYLLLRGWVAFGSSEASLRGLSAIFAVLALLPGIGLARRLVGSRTALLFGLLLITNSVWLNAAQEARAYSLVLFLNLLGAWAMVRAALGDGARYWLVAAAALGLGIYAHFFTGFTILAFVIWFVLVRRRIATAGALPAALLLGALALLPALRITLGRPVAPRWLPDVDPALIESVLVHLVGAGPTRGLLFALMAAVALVGAVDRARARPSVPPAVGAVRLLPGIWLVVGIGAPLLASLVGPPIASWRYLINAVPPLLLLSAHGASLLPRRHAVAAAALFAALDLLSLRTYFLRPPPEDWRAVSQTLFARLAPGDAVAVHAAYVKVSLAYYQSRSPDRARLPIADLGFRRDGSVDPAALEALAERAPQLWLVLSHACVRNLRQRGDEVAAMVSRAYRLVESIRFHGIWLLRYQSRTGTDPPQEAEIAPPRVCAW